MNDIFETRRAVAEPLFGPEQGSNDTDDRALGVVQRVFNSRPSILQFIWRFGLVADQTGFDAVRTTAAGHYHSEPHSCR